MIVNIGNIQIGSEDPGSTTWPVVLLAPMEDVTDVSFRLIARELGADAVYSEFISSEALIRAAAKSMKKLTTAPKERPVAIQIYGGDPDVMQDAARISEAAGPNFIDINCGCWVKNVAGRGAGAGLLKDPPRMELMVRKTVEAVSLPVTVKTRLGWDHDSINIVTIAAMMEQAGAAALTVHCRTRSQGHAGPADWSWIPKIKKAVSMPVFLNGDIKSPSDVQLAYEQTGCDGVMIGRGAISNPFIFKQIRELQLTGSWQVPSVPERVALCSRHLRHSAEVKGEHRGVLSFRKHYAGYLNAVRGGSKVKADLMQLVTVEECIARLDRFAEESEQEEISAMMEVQAV